MEVKEKTTAFEQKGGQINSNEQPNSLHNENNTNFAENQDNSSKTDNIKSLGSSTYTTLQTIFNKYLSLPEGADKALALWTIFTYGYDVFEFAPRLAILSPEPRCGKSTLLTLLDTLIYNPLNVSNISPAAIYRTVSNNTMTLLLDEVDTYINSKNNKDMVGILNSGHRRNGTVLRMGGTNYSITQRFKCFCPVALAGIGNIPDALKDRSIIISLRRKRPEEVKEILRIVKLEKDVEEVKRNCEKIMNSSKYTIANIDVPTQPFLSDRGNDNWEGLYKIAKFISNEVYNEAIEVSKLLLKSSFNDLESIRCQLLADIRQIFEEKNIDAIEATILCSELMNIEESPWLYYENKGITPYSLSSLLKFFNIKSHQMKVNGINKKRYRLKDFQDTFERYLPNKEKDV